MISREQQILEWIKQNPMISQNELAKLAGITRSGVAAHISNLVKKGYIQGKGYVITPPKYVTVIGGANMDVFGVAKEPIKNQSSYPGNIYYKLGGVGRNAAVNLSKLELKTYLITALGDDRNGERIKEDALKNGVDISHSTQVNQAATSTYMYVNQPNGDRIVGIDDMAINSYLSPEYLMQQEQVINNSDLIIIDSNLPKRSIKWLYNNVQVPIFAKAVGRNKMMNLYDGMNRLDTLVINAVEATVLTKVTITDEQTARMAAERLLERGVQNVFIYIDEVGILYQSQTQAYFFQDDEKIPRNTNGAGAAAIAGLAWAQVNHQDFLETAKFGVAAAYITTESYDAVNQKMALAKLTERQQQISD